MMSSGAFEVNELFSLSELAFYSICVSFLLPVTFLLLSAYPDFKSSWARKISEQAYA